MPQESSSAHGTPIRVVLLVDNGSNPFEMACACEIFGARRRPEIGFEPYELTVASPTRSVAMRDGLFTLSASAGLEALEAADTIIVPNRPDVDDPSRPSILAAIKAAHERGARMVGLCTGAFTLAEAGILDGRRATVHWQLVNEFVARFPKVHAEPDVLFVDDGSVLTSAGSAAALDLALHIVRLDYGAEVANHVSRRLVFSSFRDGGQRQFVERSIPAAVESPLAATLAWAQNHLDQRITVKNLADHAHTSSTTLHRQFQEQLGTTPLAWLTTQRVEFARRLLERPDVPLNVVVDRSGLGTAANLRSLMHRHAGVSPSSYRRRFASKLAGAGS